MFPEKSSGKDKKKKRKSVSNEAESAAGGEDGEALEPVDILVDNVIGFLEEATAYMRAVANQVFTWLAYVPEGILQTATKISQEMRSVIEKRIRRNK